MLRNRVIFCLIYNSGFFMQSRNFRMQRVGDINWLEKNYKFKDIAFSLDELIVVNASRGNKDMNEFCKTVERLVSDVFIPVTAGGGIRSIDDVKKFFDSGADKVIVNTALYRDPCLVRDIVDTYGSQSVIGAIDYKFIAGVPKVFVEDGDVEVDCDIDSYIGRLETLGVGEIYLNSIDKDGTGFGYDLATIRQFAGRVSMPLIAAGGAGNEAHFRDAIAIDGVAAVATANLFNFVGDGLPNARAYLIENDGNFADWLA